jgi:hypothetical protein
VYRQQKAKLNGLPAVFRDVHTPPQMSTLLLLRCPHSSSSDVHTPPQMSTLLLRCSHSSSSDVHTPPQMFTLLLSIIRLIALINDFKKP